MHHGSGQTTLNSYIKHRDSENRLLENIATTDDRKLHLRELFIATPMMME